MGVEITNYFEDMRKDMESVYYGLYFCEYADYFTRENMDATHALKLLYISLRALTVPSIPKKLIRRIFELKMLCINGWAPEIFTCANCKKEEEISYYLLEQGVALCSGCRKVVEKAMYLNGSTVFTIQYIITAPIEKLFTFVVKDDILKELIKFVDGYQRAYIEKHMKSLDLLEKLFQ